MTQATAFAQILGAMQAALQADPPVSATVYRGVRTRAVPRDLPDAIALRLVQAEIDQGAGAGVRGVWQTAVVVECYARSAADVDGPLDLLMSAAVDRLLADPSLGGPVGALVPQGVTWDFDIDGEQTACALITFLVRHVTAAGHFSI
ncbi:hypothetical protein [Paracidovorax wautersii]|uniref:hypothetical protein n=1 Tax=Paracidovorax wautersii TaxID=1177982 RepID=UPI0031DECD13